MAPKHITILGSTGSIGKSALEVVRQYPELFKVELLATFGNVDLLAEQIREFQPRAVAVYDKDAAARLTAMNPDIPVWTGPEGLNEAAGQPVDVVLCSVVGAVGLTPLIKAIDAGNRVAVANKEPFVMAGRLIMDHARAKGVEVLPVDSEHNAIFQCLHGYAKEDVHCIHLTASGGPFYGVPREELSRVAPEQATNHPTWDMGAKISVDSATLMNKGLEIIEAMWLFGLPQEQIEVVIHPQSIVHSLVEYKDGNILAQLGVTDMKFPILFALTWPERVERPMARLDLTTMKDLTFHTPDFSAFPCLRLARAAATQGGVAPAVLNAANEEAVQAFCDHRIPFLAISDVVQSVCDQHAGGADTDLDTVLAADREARTLATTYIQKVSI